MSLRKLLCVLMSIVCFMMLVLLALWQYHKYELLPRQPCSSTINNGTFFDETLKPYIFNGVITWWPANNQLTLFGIREENGEKLTFERTLVLDQVKIENNNIHGKVREVKVSVADQLPEGRVLIGEKGKAMSLIFKRINSDRWLMLINDNWVTMCENK